MPKQSWVVEFDNLKHVVRLETPFAFGADCRLFFDQELVGQRYMRDWGDVEFEFKRGGHTLQTKLVGTFGGFGTSIKLFVDGIPAERGKTTVFPPSNADSKVAKPASGYELVSEDNTREDTEVIATEEYPLDNRAGAETVTIEHEISRTVSNEITVGNATQKDSGISLELATLIKGDLSAKLIKQTGQSLGETVTRRHSIRFSAGPHQAVTYLVVWKRRVLTGEYLVLNNGTYATVPYAAYFDLTFEVQSR